MNCWGLTDKGIIRHQNEDMYLTMLNPETDTAVCIVCDGMGGARAGNIASTAAADVFMTEISSSLTSGMSFEELSRLIDKAVSAANTYIYGKALLNPEYDGMGTTMVSAIISDNTTAVVNIGDSRAYHITPEGIFRITRDHSVVEDMIDRGDLTREQARSHPNKNLITRALGTDITVRCDIYNINLNKGDFILLCTDGLTNVVSEQELLYEILHGGPLETCCSRMLEIVISRGAPDNITVVLLQR